MGIPVLYFGMSGCGKSTSLRTFGEDEILLNNVEGKPLPFRKKFKYVMKTDSLDMMIDQMKKMPCKVAVIDDAGYLMTHHFMANHRNKQGSASFTMYDEIADMMYFLVKRIKDDLPDDVIVYIILHEDTSDMGVTKLRTIGKLIDSKVCLEGMVTICLRGMSDHGQYFIRTQTDGFDIAKSPIDMFPEKEMPNDLKAVDKLIREFYGFEEEKSDAKAK